MLDSKNVNGINLLCDAIMIVQDSETWDNTLLQHCKQMNYHMTKKDVPGGFQRVIQKGDVLYLTVSIYPAKRKIMILRGDRDQSNIISWLADIQHIKSMLSVSITSSHFETIDSNQALAQQTSKHLPSTNSFEELNDRLANISNIENACTSRQIAIEKTSTPKKSLTLIVQPKIIRTIKRAVRKSSRLISQQQPMSKRKSNIGLKKKSDLSLKTNKIDTSPHGYVPLLIRKPLLPLTYEPCKEKYIINEVLCYAQNKIDCTAVDTIVRIGSDFFDTNAIAEAKQLLYKEVLIEGCRLRNYRGDDKAKDMMDIVKYLHVSPPQDTPIFLARDLSLLPNSSGEPKDISSLLKTIQQMQVNIAALTKAQLDMTALLETQSKTSAKPDTNTNSHRLTAVSIPEPVVAPDLEPVVVRDPEPVVTPLTASAPTSAIHVPVLTGDSEDNKIESDNTDSLSFAQIITRPTSKAVHSRIITNTNRHIGNHNDQWHSKFRERSQQLNIVILSRYINLRLFMVLEER